MQSIFCTLLVYCCVQKISNPPFWPSIGGKVTLNTTVDEQVPTTAYTEVNIQSDATGISSSEFLHRDDAENHPFLMNNKLPVRGVEVLDINIDRALISSIMEEHAVREGGQPS